MNILGIGIDIVEISRVVELINKYSSFRNKILTPEELLDPRSHKPEFIAGRWAAKEAVAKAIGSGFSAHCKILDISILNETGGRPIVYISGDTLEYLKSIHSKYSVHISISHDTYATAFCILESLRIDTVSS